MQTIGLYDVTLLFNLATCWSVPQDSKGSGLYLSLTLSLNEIVRLLVGECELGKHCITVLHLPSSSL